MLAPNNLVSEISPAITEAWKSQHEIRHLPILILFPHNRCNCRCVMCDIWKIRETRQLLPSDLAPHIESIRSLGVQWAVLSGGEPLLHEGLSEILALFKAEKIRTTLLSTGILLDDYATLVANNVNEIIVSLDGPPAIHNAIRRIPDAFELLQKGIASVRRVNPDMPIHARCTIQRLNHAALIATLESAKKLELNSISFLAADTTSEAFNRPDGWNDARKSTVQLKESEIETLISSIRELQNRFPDEFATRFIRETPEKLYRIAARFQSRLGLAEAVAPRCNAPWTSAVIESDGTVRPCFFHSAIGNLNQGSLFEILNGERALNFRASLNIETNPVCRNCVCSLYHSNTQGE